jgi:hypothetical protein
LFCWPFHKLPCFCTEYSLSIDWPYKLYVANTQAIKFEFWYLLRSLRLIDILPVISQSVP